MQEVAMLFGAAVAGYAGGWLAWHKTRRRNEQELKEAVAALLSELTLAAAQATERVSRERAKLEELLAAASGAAPNGGAPGAGGEQAAAAATSPKEVEEQSLPDPVQAKVLALAARGREPVAIAQELGLGRGEVELILNLKTLGSSGSRKTPA